MARPKKVEEPLEDLQPEQTEAVVEPKEPLPDLIKTEEPKQEPVSEKPYTEAYFEMLGKPIPDRVEVEGDYCHTCQEKFRTGLWGESICPAMLEICQRNTKPVA